MAVSVPVVALLIAIGFQVNARSVTAREATDELTRIETLETLATLQTASVLPDLGVLRQEMSAEGNGSFLIEMVVSGYGEMLGGAYLGADDARAEMSVAASGNITAEAEQVFDRQRETSEALLETFVGGQPLTDELIADAELARMEADLAFAELAVGSASDAWITYIGAIDAGRSTAVEYAYVMSSLIGLGAIDEARLAELGGIRSNATQRVIMGLQPDLQIQVQNVLTSDSMDVWDAAVAAAREIVAGRAEPWQINDVATLTGDAFQLQLQIDTITAEAVDRVRSELVTVETDAKSERTRLLLLAAALLAITAGLTVWILQSVMSPLRRLTKRAAELADGEIDGPRVDHGRHDALAELGETIEDVAEGLRHLGQQFEAMAEGNLDDVSLESAGPGFVGEFVQDWVQEVRQASDALTAEALHDELTGLLNRRGLMRHLGRMAGGPEVAVVYVDLDKFKAVNDQHGHHAGDAVLKVIGQRLLGFVRTEDPVCRLGGDEFVLLVSGVDRQDMPIFISRIELGLSEPISFEGTRHSVGCSVGVGWLGPGDLLEPILEEADRAMLEVKSRRGESIPR